MDNVKKDYRERLSIALNTEMEKGINPCTLEHVKDMLKVDLMLKEMNEGDGDGIVSEVERKDMSAYMYDLDDEFKGYMKYKELYVDTGNESDKHMMCDELRHLMMNLQNFVVMVYENTTSKEERDIIKTMLKELRNKMPI